MPMSQSTARDNLGHRQRRFVEEYAIDLNASQAALRAGYSPNSAREMGCENLTKPHIRAALDEQMAENAAVAQLRSVDVIQDLMELRDICMGRKAAPRLVKRDGELVSEDMRVFDQAGANGALDKLIKHLGLYERDNAQKQSAIVAAILQLPGEVQDRVLEGLYEIVNDNPALPDNRGAPPT